MRSHVAVLACLLLVVAGCSGSPASGGDERTVNPALRETPTVSPTPDVRAPPATAVGEPVRLRSLLDTHRRALADRSVTVTVTTRRVDVNGTLVSRSVVRSEAAGIEQFVRATAVGQSPPSTVAPFNRSYWRNDTVTVRRRPHRDASVSVRLDTDVPAAKPFDATGARAMFDVLGPYDLAYAGTVVRDGETRHLVTQGTAAQPSVPLRSDLQIRVFVTPRGLVERVVVSYRTREFGRPMDVTETVTVTNVSSTTVSRPPWVDAALANESTGS